MPSRLSEAWQPSMMCLRDSPASLAPGPTGRHTFVHSSIELRRTPLSALPNTSSARPRAYRSAVSNVVMPASRAAVTHAAAASSSSWLPWVTQLPYATALTRRPDRPSCLNSIRGSSGRPALSPNRSNVVESVGDRGSVLARRPEPGPVRALAPGRAGGQLLGVTQAGEVLDAPSVAGTRGAAAAGCRPGTAVGGAQVVERLRAGFPRPRSGWRRTWPPSCGRSPAPTRPGCGGNWNALAHPDCPRTSWSRSSTGTSPC